MIQAATRTKALGAAAAGLVLVLAVVGVDPPPATTTTRGPTSGAAPTGSATVVLAGAPRDLDAAGLRKRYAAIGAAQPFKARSFDPPPARATVAPTASYSLGERRPVAQKPPPDKLELRFTGLLGEGATRAAILEESGTGRGLLARAGGKLGTIDIAEVGSATISFIDSGTRKDLDLGESFLFPLAVSSSVEALKPSGADVAVPTRTGASNDGTVNAAPISAEDRQATLERLRERRRRTLQPQGGD